jgi:hypothetical protein
VIAGAVIPDSVAYDVRVDLAGLKHDSREQTGVEVMHPDSYGAVYVVNVSQLIERPTMQSSTLCHFQRLITQGWSKPLTDCGAVTALTAKAGCKYHQWLRGYGAWR